MLNWFSFSGAQTGYLQEFKSILELGLFFQHEALDMLDNTTLKKYNDEEGRKIRP